MSTLIASQLHDALAFMKALSEVIEGLPDDPEWGVGLRLRLPSVIPLRSDYATETKIYAWLIANDFNGYDLSTVDPNPLPTSMDAGNE